MDSKTITPTVPTVMNGMATRTETKAAIRRMHTLVSDHKKALEELEKSKAEKSNTDTTELDRQIRVQKLLLEGLKECKRDLIKVFKTLFEPKEEKEKDEEGRGTKRKKELKESNDGSKKKKKEKNNGGTMNSKKKPMQWDKVTGGHNGQFFQWDRRQQKMVSTENMELSFKLDLNKKEGDLWDDVVWCGRRPLVIQPAYSFRTAYGAYGTTGHVLIIKPDKDEWTRKQLYRAIEREFLNDKEDYGTGTPKPRLCLENYNHHPFLEGFVLTNELFEVDGKMVPILRCRWGS